MSKKKFGYGPTKSAKEPRINLQIHAQKVRLVSDGKGVEVLDLKEALRMAEQAGMDLVEVSGDQDPPVCKIIDFGKWKFEQQKKKKDQSRNQHVIHIKEIKLRPKIGDHDYAIKKNQAISFLEKGDKVKVTLRFRGREITHPELGMVLMNRLAADVDDAGVVETPAKMEGRQIVMILGSRPKKKSESAKKEVEKEPGDKNLAQDKQEAP